MSDVKICRDCAHVMRINGVPIYTCQSPSNSLGPDLVTGDPQPMTRNCQEARQRTDACGPIGRWFEKYDYSLYSPTKEKT